MGLYRDQGVVLRTMRFGEADRIITIFAQDRGKLRAVVKGARKTKSRFGARLAPFSCVDVQLYEGRGELHTVSQAELIRSHTSISSIYDAYLCGQVMCEAVDRVLPDQTPNPQLYRLLLAGLCALEGHVAAGVVPHALRCAFLLKLLGVSGVGPQLRACVHCGETTGLCSFAVFDGGVVCSSCRRASDPGVSAKGISLLRMMWQTPLAEMPDVHTGEVDGLVSKALEYYLDGRLRSLSFRSV